MFEEGPFMELLQTSDRSTGDQKLFSALLGEISCISEMLETLEGESVSMEDAVGMIRGLQRDIIQLYRAAQS